MLSHSPCRGTKEAVPQTPESYSLPLNVRSPSIAILNHFWGSNLSLGGMCDRQASPRILIQDVFPAGLLVVALILDVTVHVLNLIVDGLGLGFRV